MSLQPARRQPVCIFFLTMPECNKCEWEHGRPIGLKCKYYLAAIAKCKDLKVPEEDFKLYLDVSQYELDNDIAKLAESGQTEPLVTGNQGPDPGALSRTILEVLQSQNRQIQDLTGQFARLEASIGGETGLKQVPLSGGGRSYEPLGQYSGGAVPANVMAQPLTEALNQLSQAIDPTSPLKSKGIVFRPEFYVQYHGKGTPIKNMDHTKLNVLELWYGMARVSKHLRQSGGDIDSYLEHMLFVAKQASTANFTDSALVNYDREIIDKLIMGDASTFLAGDPIAVSSHLNAGGTKALQQALQQNSSDNNAPASQQRSRRARRKNWQDRRGKGIPEDYPPDNCYDWNYGTCENSSCSKSHACRICKQRHRAVGCPDKHSVRKQ